MHVPTDFTESQAWPAVLDERVQLRAEPAVYALLHELEFGRLRGTSRVLYLGSTGQLGGLSESCRLRIYRYPNGAHARDLTRRVQLLLDAGFVVRFCWKYLASEAEAKTEETRLLNKYLEEHLELPPFNHRKERRNEGIA